MNRTAKRVGVLAVMVGLFLSDPAAAREPCSARPCSHVLHAKRKLQRWRTPERFGEQTSITARVFVNGRRVRTYEDGSLQSVYAGRGVVVVMTATRARGPLHLRYVASRRTRFRLVYRAT